jgi:cytochrome c-type biogenesis protein
MAADPIALGGVFVAGALSFLSPCVLPLVPPYLAYLAGASVSELAKGSEAPSGLRARAFITAIAFVAGFSVVFIALGAGASLIGEWLRAHSILLAQIAGFAILAMGLHFLGLFRLPFLMREARLSLDVPGGRVLPAFGMGLAFAFGWTPCIGPVLAGVLAVAASEATVARGAVLLALYSGGLGVPFLLAALAIGPFTRALPRMAQHAGRVEKAMGVLLVLTSIAFLTGQISALGFYLLEAFPALGRLG